MPHQTPVKKPAQRQLMRQIRMLVIVLVLTATYFIWQGMRNKGADKNPQTPQIETNFDTQTLDQVKDIDSDYPDLDTGDVGKDDPFSL